METFLDILIGLQLIDTKFFYNVVTSGLYILVFVGIRHLLIKQLEKREWANDSQRIRAFAHVKQVIFVLILFGIIVIWMPEIRSFAFSIAAITVAIVIASKELIMCLSGAFLKSTNDLFSVGDRIQVGPYTGDVMGSGFLTTQVFEVDACNQKTGRLINIPNSLFLTTPVINETLAPGYILTTTRIPLPILHDIEAAQKVLREVLLQITAPHLDDAKKEFKRYLGRTGLREPTAEPRVIVQCIDEKSMALVARYPVPAHKKLLYEQQLLTLYFEKQQESDSTASSKKP